MTLLESRDGTYNVGDRYRKGGFWRIDDRDGSRQRNYNTVKEWNGAIISQQDWEPRHPQDFVKGIPDRQDVPDPRPVESVANATFVGPFFATLTVSVPAGGTVLTLDSVVGIAVGDAFGIMLDNLTRFMSAVAFIQSSNSIVVIIDPLPFGASAGNTVVDAGPSNSAIIPSFALEEDGSLSLREGGFSVEARD